MNMTVTRFITAASLGLAVCTAYAQQTPPSGSQGTQGSQGGQGNMGNPQTTPTYPNRPPPANPTAGNPMSGTSTGGMANGANAAATPFDSIDTSHQGYLTRENAATDSWLASHFAQCDADRDGRVTRAEYTACSRAHP
jgi:hypothetical protein